MQTLLTKIFSFSASHTSQNKVFGHNYKLGITVEADETSEKKIIELVESEILPKVHSRDLGEGVTQASLLKDFWNVLEPGLEPIRIVSLCLERDERTKTMYFGEEE